MEEERGMNEDKRAFDEAKKKASQNIGKTKLVKKSRGQNDVEDVDFEEVD